METIAPTFFIEKILIDHLPEKRLHIKRVIEAHDFGRIIEHIISSVSGLLYPVDKHEANPEEIAIYAYSAIKRINEQVVRIANPEAKNEVQGLLSAFFLAVIKEIELKKPAFADQLRKEIAKGIRVAAKSEGYDEKDLFRRLKLEDLNFPADFLEAIERTRPGKRKPTRFATILSGPELKLLSELLQQYGISRRKDQFKNLFLNDGKQIKPVICTNEKVLHFIHFMYCINIKYKWVSVENAGVWEGIKECFVDQDKKVLGIRIRQYYHREIKKPKVNSLIVNNVHPIFKHFFKKFPDRKRTEDGR